MCGRGCLCMYFKCGCRFVALLILLPSAVSSNPLCVGVWVCCFPSLLYLLQYCSIYCNTHAHKAHMHTQIPSPPPPRTHTHTHTHIHTSTHTHTHTHTHLYSHIYTRTYLCTHTHTHMHVHTGEALALLHEALRVCYYRDKQSINKFTVSKVCVCVCVCVCVRVRVYCVLTFF